MKPELAEAIKVIASVAEKKLKATRKIDQYYPAEGPLRRELYPKHLAFFRAGRNYRERLFIAGNRVGKCISGETVIDTPYGNPHKVKDIDGPHWVWAWDGQQRVPILADKPFKKPQEMIYRVWLSNGQFVDCAAEHRFLTESGWFFLSDLVQFVPYLPETIEGVDPSWSYGDVLRYLRKLPNFLVNYPIGFHFYDEQFLSGQATCSRPFPSQGDVPKHSQLLLRLGDWAHKCKDSLLQFFYRLSNQYVFHQTLGLCVESLGRGACNSSLWCYNLPRKSQQPSTVEAVPLRSGCVNAVHPNQFLPALVSSNGLSDFIIAYQPIGVNDIYDFNVPVYHNYCTAGIIHHNSEGVGGYELALHLTGQYPCWWEGKRFKRGVRCWAAGDTGKTTRDILQEKLLGPVGQFGTGLIPRECLHGKPLSKPGVPEAIEIVRVKHKSGDISQLVFKSYDQKREAFQGTEIDVAWLDEEPPLPIYIETLMRTMTTDGLVLCTFTPLMGLSEVVLSFLPGGQMQEIDPDLKTGPKFAVMATWDDAPHLTAEQKEALWASIPPHQRDARSKGIPQLGAGAIYPIGESEILVDPFEIPGHWPRGYGMDVGWNCTGALWGAIDRDSDIVYLWSEYKAGQAEPPIHASAIIARGKNMPGVIDPASRGRGQKDGEQLFRIYKDLGLNLNLADNAVEAGIYEVWMRLSTGRLKVFSTLRNFLGEYRVYRRNEDGKVVKENDHLMDCLRYFCMSGLEYAKRPYMKIKPYKPSPYAGDYAWMGS